jgi:hypothetical protein
MVNRPSLDKRLFASLIAGGIAIVLNTLALQAADLVHLETAHGGLLHLIRPVLSLVAPVPSSAGFQIAFHVVVGILMALFYAYLLEPRLPGDAWMKGLICAIAVWLANATVVLPATDQGFAGAAHLTFRGMIWFAGAHTLFFILLACIYERILRN